MSVWYAAYGPAGMPRALVERINAEINKALAMPEVRARLESIGVDVVQSTPEQLTSALLKDSERYAKIIKDLNIKAD